MRSTGSTEVALAGRLRANPDWELTVLERLDPADRAALDLTSVPEAYGVLRRRTGPAGLKAVGPDVALLLLTLSQPLPLPAYVRSTFGSEAEDAVAQLIADGTVEVELEGRWVSGPAAFRPKREPVPVSAPPVRSGSRSSFALQAASGVAWDDPMTLADFLYRFGTAPQTSDRARAWADAEAIRADFRLGEGGPAPTLSADRAWWIFPGDPGAPDTANPKLYAGIALEALGPALTRLMDLRDAAGVAAPAFKMGATCAGLHRPDRLVIYFGSPEVARLWADKLAKVWGDLPPAPVPFTAACEPEGRVSWGVDPPQEGRTWWDDSGSWRSFVVDTLAAAWVQAHRAGDTTPWHFALECGRLAGVDPNTWAPTGRGWTL